MIRGFLCFTLTYDIFEIVEKSRGGKMNILFVCTGNTCRSPMAEALLKTKAPQLNVRSAGVFATSGAPATEETLRVLQENEIEFSHQATLVRADLLEWADYVLTMTSSHRNMLEVNEPKYIDKYFTLKEFVQKVDKEGEEQLQQKRVDFEQKRTAFLKENVNLEQAELEQLFSAQFLADYTEICSLEAQVSDIDISDPFGGDRAIYRQTFAELEDYIDQLLEQLIQEL